jgi:hypothetical protein
MMTSFPTFHRDILPADISVKDTTAHANILLNAFRAAINGGLSVQQMVDGVVDELEDETGVTTSIGADYDSTDDYYQNTPGGYTADLIPTMTGYTSPSGTVTMSRDNTAAYAAWKAFDDNGSTYWNTSQAPPQWIQYAFSSAQVITQITMLAFPSGDEWQRMPYSWTLKGDGNTLYTGVSTAFSVGQKRSFQFENTTAYTSYRLDVSTTNGTADVSIMEIELMGSIDPDDMILVSDPYTAETEPDEAYIVIWQEDVDAVTLDTDLKAWASIDNGNNWDQATLTEIATLDTGRILTGTADVSGQTGTAMKWQITTHNNKQLKVHAVGLEWS